MDKIVRVSLLNIPSIVCIIAAACLAFYGMSGWGWFLLIGVLVLH